MKNTTNPSKIIRSICLVAATLSLCALCIYTYVMQCRLVDAQSDVKQMKSLVDFYGDKVDQAKEALESQQIINAELLETNEKLSKALDAYDYDFSAATPKPPRYLDVPLDEDLQDHIWLLCCAYDIEEHYELIYAIIYRESSFRSDCKSSSSWGLMQINKCNHENLSKKLGINDFLDPYQNVHAGIYMIANLIHKYNDVNDALMAYNMGEGGAKKLWRQGVHTTGYTKRVLATYKQYTEDI